MIMDATARQDCAGDVTATLERKLEAFACFETEWRDYPHPRNDRALRAHAELYGASVGCEYAEPFVLVRNVEAP